MSGDRLALPPTTAFPQPHHHDPPRPRRGEYRYFKYPLPVLIGGLHTALYPRLAPIANDWNEQVGIDTRYPAKQKDFLDPCHNAGRERSTPLLLQYAPGDYQEMGGSRGIAFDERSS